MNTRMLLAGIALTFLAFRYESRKAAPDAASAQPTHAARVWNGIGHAFNAVLADAIRIGVTNSMATLAQYEPAVKETRGEMGQRARKLASQIKKANERANEQLSLGNTSMALDFAVQASTHEDALRKLLFERR